MSKIGTEKVFNFGNLITAKWTPPQSAPPAMQAQECKLNLLFVGGHSEQLSGADAQAAWDHLCLMSNT